MLGYRNKPLKKQSTRQGAARARQQQAYRVVKEESDGCCVGCRGTWFLTPSHCYSQKQHPEHRANPRNILILCVNCHDLFEHNKAKFRRVCPEAWAETMVRMKEVDLPAFRTFQRNHPQLFRCQ